MKEAVKMEMQPYQPQLALKDRGRMELPILDLTQKQLAGVERIQKGRKKKQAAAIYRPKKLKK